MTNSEDKLKDQLQDLLSSKEFSFEEAQWTKMSAMLDRRKKRRAIGYIIFSGVLVGILLFTGISLFTGTETTKTAQNTIVSKESTKQSENNNKENSANAEATMPSGENPAPAAIPGDAAKMPAINQPARTQKAPEKIEHVVDEPVVRDNNITKPETATSKVNKAPVQKTNAPVNAPVAPLAVVQSNDNHQQTKSNTDEVAKSETKAADNNKESDPASNNTNDIVQENKNVDKPVEILPEVKAFVPAATIPVSNLAENKEKPTAPQTKSDLAAETQTVSQEPAPAVVNVNSVTPEAVPVSSAAVIAAKPDTDYVKAKRPDINIEAGGTYMFGWKDGDSRDASGINPLIGINYFMPIGKELKFGVGIQYTSIGHLNNSNYTATKTRLDFGSYTRYTSFTPQVLHYLNVPIKVGFVIDENSMAGAGVTLGYLLTVNSKVEQYEEDINGIYNYSTHKEKGYTQSFNDFQAQLTFFYERRIWTHLRVSGELMYGLTDVKNGNAIPSSVTERNSGIKVSLIYRIFEK